MLPEHTTLRIFNSTSTFVVNAKLQLHTKHMGKSVPVQHTRRRGLSTQWLFHTHTQMVPHKQCKTPPVNNNNILTCAIEDGRPNSTSGTIVGIGILSLKFSSGKLHSSATFHAKKPYPVMHRQCLNSIVGATIIASRRYNADRPTQMNSATTSALPSWAVGLQPCREISIDNSKDCAYRKQINHAIEHQRGLKDNDLYNIMRDTQHMLRNKCFVRFYQG